MEQLRVRGATRVFGPDAGLFGVDLTVIAGRVHALVGLNGAGKTTLMRAVLGMVRLAAGSVSINNAALDRMRSSAWRSVGHLVAHPFAYPELSIRTNLSLAARLHGVERSAVIDVVEAAIAELHLERYAGVAARRLSQGNRQRLGLAAALQHHPDVIVLDEPTSALDPAGVLVLREILVRRVRAGASVLVSSHHLDEVARIAHDISVLNYGRVIGTLAAGTPDLEREFFEMVRANDEQRQRR